MLTVWWVRHGEPAYVGLTYEFSHPAMRHFAPLTKRGIEQVTSTAGSLKAVPATVILSSPFTRAMHTAVILSHVLGLPVEVEYDLHEWLPDRHMRSISQNEADTRWNMMIAGRLSSNDDWECREALMNRVRSGLARHYDGRNIIVSGHGTVIMTQAGLSKIPEYGSVTECTYTLVGNTVRPSG